MRRPISTQKPRVLALDLDGTLITCRSRQVELAAHVARLRGGARVNRAAFWRLKRAGASTRDAFVSLGWSMADASVLADDWVAEIESPDWLARDELVPDAVAALRYLASRGTRAVILTARRSRSGVVQQLDRLGITSLIDSVIVVPPADVVRKKALYLRRLSAEGFVGDTEADARAAALAGVKFVAVSGGQRSAAFLIRAGVPLVCRDLMSALRRLSL